jgi:hypothetical protein
LRAPVDQAVHRPLTRTDANPPYVPLLAFIDEEHLPPERWV